MQKIYDYIAEDNPEAAERTVNAIHAHAEALLQFPEIGYRYRSDAHVRVLLYGHYRIAYLVKDDRSIEILGVFHGALDIRRYLS